MPYPQQELSKISPDKSQQITRSLMELHSLGRCETDDQVEARIHAYFEVCASQKIRPGIESLSCALSISRKTLYAWASGRGCSPYRSELINSAKSLINAYIEQAFLSGVLNPAAGIFCLKNWCSYSDNVALEDKVTFEEEPVLDRDQLAEELGIDLEEYEDERMID